jgi:hypothetical protein
MGGIETPDDVERPGIDRRTLIKRAAATGAVVWTAPVIIDSLASPAAAITCSGTCFQFQIDGDCNPATTEAVSTSQCLLSTPAGCTTLTNVAAGVAFSNVCFTATTCTGNTVTFTLNTTGNCWTAGSCGANRRFVTAVARVTGGGDPQCLNPSALTDSTVSFTKATAQAYDFFKFIVQCSCT